MIDPSLITTVRVGELQSEPFSPTSKIAHEVGTELKYSEASAFASWLSSYLGTISGVGFRAISVSDGQTLPSTTQEEFILVGKGTYNNVAGGAQIICTEELNALISNGSYWSIGVEIPINFEFNGITQEIRTGFINTVPSEDAVFNALALKADIADSNIFNITDQVITIAGTQDFTVPDGDKVIAVYVNGTLHYKTTSNNATLVNRWSQTGNIVTLTKATVVNNYVYIISK